LEEKNGQPPDFVSINEYETADPDTLSDDSMFRKYDDNMLKADDEEFELLHKLYLRDKAAKVRFSAATLF